MQNNVFQQQTHDSFTLCFLQKCSTSTKTQPKNSPSSSSKTNQRSGLVWKVLSDKSERTSNLKTFFSCQNVQTEHQMITFDQSKKKCQFQRIRQKKAYDSEARSIKKLNKIKEAIICRDNKIQQQRSVSKNKLSLSTRKSNQKSSHAKSEIKREFLSFNNQLIKRSDQNQTNVKGNRRGNQQIVNSQLKNQIIQAFDLPQKCPNARPPLNPQSVHKMRVQNSERRVNFSQAIAVPTITRPIDAFSAQKSQVKMSQGLFSTRHASNYNLYSSISQRDSNKFLAENRKPDILRNQRSQILVFGHQGLKESDRNSLNPTHKASNFVQRIRGYPAKLNQANHNHLINITERLKSSPIQDLADHYIKDQINESIKNASQIQAGKPKSPDMKSYMRRSYNESPAKNRDELPYSSYLNFVNTDREEQRLKSFKTKTVQSIVSSNVSIGPVKVEQSTIMVNFFNPPKQILDQLNSPKPLSLFKKDSVASYRGSGVFNQINRGEISQA